jgi:hypothetical protein
MANAKKTARGLLRLHIGGGHKRAAMSKRGLAGMRSRLNAALRDSYSAEAWLSPLPRQALSHL